MRFAAEIFCWSILSCLVHVITGRGRIALGQCSLLGNSHGIANASSQHEEGQHSEEDIDEEADRAMHDDGLREWSRRATA